MSKDLRSSLVEGLEEHFIVRVKDDAARQNISELLRTDTEGNQNKLEILFETERVGRLTITDARSERHVYAISLHDLPTTVETYKSHNHVNLVKLSDIGQVLTVWPHQEDATVEDVVAELMRLESIKELPLEDEDGVTTPMRQARARVFRKTFDVDPELVRIVEDQLVSILNGEAPEGWRFEDVEETYVVDQATGKGKWTPSSEVYASAAKTKTAAPKKKAAKATKPAAKAKKAAAADDDEDEDDDENTDSDGAGADGIEDDGGDEK